MSNADTRTVEQLVMGLALLEVPCPDTDNEGDPDGAHALGCFGGCHGTGKVAKYPMLREPCPSKSHNPCIGELFYTTQNGGSYSESVIIQNCQGRGYLIVTTERALLEAIASTGRKVYLSKQYHGGWRVGVPFEGQESFKLYSGDTVQKALARALCKAEGIEEVA